MIETASLAGFWAAHGIWSVSDGETLIPMLGYEQPDGERGMTRFVLDDLGDGARAAQEALEANADGAHRAVAVVDAYLHLEEGKTDALIIDAVRYGLTPGTIRLAVPYRPKTDSTEFAVLRPQIIEINGFDSQDFEAVADAFFSGVDSHEQAAAVWNAHLDPSA
ncbi:hypothetical protein F0L68_18810 [Solihabitans fulvus]|uniref:Uncharacterized protein n=1 Tax=Solihabitans fulvus TaxID=1892852 RepID=A0A5B2XDP5_9PSEU|nr:hypothetical protein [Solihabitans fulvus]KAA2261110.1 hypothetical protein F0L68_18810 [Solihabitans fulvus]